MIARVPSRCPFCIDWLPDGRLLVVSAPRGAAPAPGARRLAGDPRRPAGLGDAAVERDRRRRPRQRLRQQHRLRLPGRRRSRPGIVALVTPDGVGARGRRRHRVPQRHGGHARQRDADRRRVVRQAAHGLRHRRRRQPVRTGGSGPSSATATPTASASTPRAPSGTPTSPTSAACACARAARCCRRSSSTAAASPACSAAPDGRTLFMPSTSGAAPRTWRGPEGPGARRRGPGPGAGGRRTAARSPAMPPGPQFDVVAERLGRDGDRHG